MTRQLIGRFWYIRTDTHLLDNDGYALSFLEDGYKDASGKNCLNDRKLFRKLIWIEANRLITYRDIKFYKEFMRSMARENPEIQGPVRAICLSIYRKKKT